VGAAVAGLSHDRCVIRAGNALKHGPSAKTHAPLATLAPSSPRTKPPRRPRSPSNPHNRHARDGGPGPVGPPRSGRSSSGGAHQGGIANRMAEHRTMSNFVFGEGVARAIDALNHYIRIKTFHQDNDRVRVVAKSKANGGEPVATRSCLELRKVPCDGPHTFSSRRHQDRARVVTMELSWGGCYHGPDFTCSPGDATQPGGWAGLAAGVDGTPRCHLANTGRP
jgi:hypothetical protein